MNMTKQLSESLLAACKAAGIEKPRYIAQDEDGEVIHHDEKPSREGWIHIWGSGGPRKRLDHQPYADDWKDSLMEWVDHIADTSKMTDEQINIAIAEACGWTCLGQVEGCKPHGYPPDARKPTTKELLEAYGPSPWDVPDYCNHFNAMHEAMLLHPRKELLRDFLYLEVLEDPTNTTNEPAWATAKQWAMAYLRSLGKWIE
jgi:hypothetical protein